MDGLVLGPEVLTVTVVVGLVTAVTAFLVARSRWREAPTKISQEPSPFNTIKPSGDPNLIKNFKLNRLKEMNREVEERLTENEKKMEKMYRMESQQIAKIFSLLRDNQDSMGNMTMDDLKRQMGMYKETPNDDDD